MKLLRYLVLGALTLAACGPKVPPKPPVPIVPTRITAEERAVPYIKNGALVIDVRSPSEFQSGHLPNAINIPHTEIESRIESVTSNRDRQIVLYCRTSRRAGLAEVVLTRLGYRRVLNGGSYEPLLRELTVER